MRYALLLLALAALPLAGCACGPTTEPILELKSPIWLSSKPVLQPAGYAMPVQAAPQMVAVPQYQVQQYAAPCLPAAPQYAAPCAPGYTPGYQYANPPIPAAPR